ncbi:MAG: hypothetical protein RIT14_2053 [Pseudomonadota bacterium]|jgi:hypothetical protein
MLVKTVILFLGAMALVAMVGNWLSRGAIGRAVGRRLDPRQRLRASASTCARCGRYVIGAGGCDCRKG